MFCPNCGEKIVFEQVYCRSCGMGIGEMSQSLSKYQAELEGKTDWLKRIGLFSIGIVSGLILLFVFIVFARGFRLSENAGIFFLFSLIAVLSGIISVLFFEKSKPKKAKSEVIENKNYIKPAVESWKTSKQLDESSFQPIGSVTDNTTELFTAKVRRTSGELE